MVTYKAITDPDRFAAYAEITSPAIQAARAAYHSYDYQDAIKALGDGANRDYRIILGC